MLESDISGHTSMIGVYLRTIRNSEQVSSKAADAMPGAPLTDRQRRVLEAIRSSVRERGVAPSHVEIARAVGLPTGSASAVEGHLKALARKGWIEIEGVARGIRLLREGAPIVDAAHLPDVAAGSPTAVEERRNLPRLNDFESLSREFDARPDFFVRVEGDSFADAGFASGDIVAVRSQPEARDGDVVLARLGRKVALRRFQRIDAATVRLHPVNPSPEHEPVEIGPTTEDAEIVGIVVGAIVGTRGRSRMV